MDVTSERTYTKANAKKTSGVPTLSLKDLSSTNLTIRRQFINEFFAGLKYYGFIILKDHSISTTLLDHSYTLLENLFALPEMTKRKYIAKIGGRQRGYTPFGAEHAKNSQVHDLKEFWHVGRDLPKGHRYGQQYPENIWPQEIGEFQKIFSELYVALDSVGELILSALTEPLDVAPDYFNQMTKNGNNILRLLHYPPLTQGADSRCIRAAAHEDINLMTILVAATTSGLELLDRDGQWLPVETDKNNLIIDAGDMMARLTNDVIPATTHRVVNPQDGQNGHRYSMPFFIHPNPDSVIECLPSCTGAEAKYPIIGAQELLLERLKQIGMLEK